MKRLVALALLLCVSSFSLLGCAAEEAGTKPAAKPANKAEEKAP